jgi:hypothetical protein
MFKLMFMPDAPENNCNFKENKNTGPFLTGIN